MKFPFVFVQLLVLCKLASSFLIKRDCVNWNKVLLRDWASTFSKRIDQTNIHLLRIAEIWLRQNGLNHLRYQPGMHFMWFILNKYVIGPPFFWTNIYFLPTAPRCDWNFVIAGVAYLSCIKTCQGLGYAWYLQDDSSHNSAIGKSPSQGWLS